MHGKTRDPTQGFVGIRPSPLGATHSGVGLVVIALPGVARTNIADPGLFAGKSPPGNKFTPIVSTPSQV